MSYSKVLKKFAMAALIAAVASTGTAALPVTTVTAIAGTKSTTKSAIIADGWYYIKNVYSQKYVEVTNAKDSNGANVAQYQGNGNNCQKWYVRNLGNN